MPPIAIVDDKTLGGGRRGLRLVHPALRRDDPAAGQRIDFVGQDLGGRIIAEIARMDIAQMAQIQEVFDYPRRRCAHGDGADADRRAIAFIGFAYRQNLARGRAGTDPYQAIAFVLMQRSMIGALRHDCTGIGSLIVSLGNRHNQPHAQQHGTVRALDRAWTAPRPDANRSTR
jgi:hypothetical protein